MTASDPILESADRIIAGAEVPVDYEAPPPPRRLRTVRLSDVTAPDAVRLTSEKTLPLWRGMLAALVGEGETCKSLLAAHAVIDTATTGRGVLVLDGEMTAPTWRSRLVELCADDEILDRVHYAEMTADAVDVPAVHETCRAENISLVLWDSALSLLSRTARSENDNAEVGRVYDKIRDIVRAGPAGLIVDHTPRGAANLVSRGATAKFNALDIAYGVRLVNGSVPNQYEPWSTVLTVEKDRHGLLGRRRDREATFVPLGGRRLVIEVAELDMTPSHRLSNGSPIGVAAEKIAALHPPPTSANDACKRVAGTRTVVLAAFKLWAAQGGSGGSAAETRESGSGGSSSIERTTEPPGSRGSELVRTTEPPPNHTTT